ncbi:zinc finger BED domain-containing 4-like protein [Labeo rohita]|nr:zinc finger BED domain-containing 4-like protein [Labeo rohita]
MYLAEKVKFKNRLAMARKVTIGIDIWTKKGLTASFLGVSACYLNVQDSKAEHILLNLKQMVHPHTANSIVTLVEECTEEWGILKEKIIMIITDNGSNMVSAFRVEEEDTSSDENDSNKDSDEEEEADERYGTLERTPCVVHTLQLVVNMVKKEQAIKRLLDKVRHLVRQFRKSSVATEWLLEQCGLILIKDCETRWSSSFLMWSRLLKVKDHVTSVADTMGWDCLLPSEW